MKKMVARRPIVDLITNNQHSELDSSMRNLKEKISELEQQKAEASQNLQTKKDQLDQRQNDHSQKTKDMEVLLSQNKELEKEVYLDSICSVFYQYTLAGIRLFHINISC